MIYLRGEGQFRVPDVDRIPQQVTITDKATLRGGHPDLHLNVHCGAEAFIEQAKHVWASTRRLCDIHNTSAVCAVDDTDLFARECGVVYAGGMSRVTASDCGTVVATNRARALLNGKCYCLAFECSDVDAANNAYCMIEAHDFSRVIAESSSRIARRGPGAPYPHPERRWMYHPVRRGHHGGLGTDVRCAHQLREEHHVRLQVRRKEP